MDAMTISNSSQRVHDLLDETDGVAAIPMKTLREIYAPHRDRLSRPLVDDIALKLREAEIGYITNEWRPRSTPDLPCRETETVMLYKQKSPTGVILAAMNSERLDVTAAALQLFARAFAVRAEPTQN
jgi:hypothetical protein